MPLEIKGTETEGRWSVLMLRCDEEWRARMKEWSMIIACGLGRTQQNGLFTCFLASVWHFSLLGIQVLRSHTLPAKEKGESKLRKFYGGLISKNGSGLSDSLSKRNYGFWESLPEVKARQKVGSRRTGENHQDLTSKSRQSPSLQSRRHAKASHSEASDFDSPNKELIVLIANNSKRTYEKNSDVINGCYFYLEV